MKIKFTLLTLTAACLVLLSAAPPRVRAAIIPVTSTNDNGPGSLRAALASAANGDTIDAAGVSGTITLTNGELIVSNSVTLLGPGAAKLTVSGNYASRVFNLTGTNVTISGLTIANGSSSAGLGGGLCAGGGTGCVATVNNCIIANNSATSLGGGIYSGAGVTLTISNCTVSGNETSAGGGLYIYHGTVNVIASTFSDNWGGDGSGGAIFNNGHEGSTTLAIIASTFSGNWAGDTGGAIYNSGFWYGNATATINASTFSGNSAGDYGNGGAAIYNNANDSGTATLRINASTFSGNYSPADSGILNYGFNGLVATLEIGDTILDSYGNHPVINNISGEVISDGYNLSSDNGSGCLTNVTDHVSISDLMLGPLQDNGGPTWTHALLPGSPAIDQGKRDAVTNLVSMADQRGFARPVDFASIVNAAGGDSSDVGAFELQYGPIVSTDDSGPGTLRAALADVTNGGIVDATGVSGTITLTSGQLSVSNNLTILGPGPAALTVSGNNSTRVFDITGTNVTISGLTIANGISTMNGAGINSGGSPGSILGLNNCVVADNITMQLGGGIFNSAGVTLAISNCTISGNVAGGNGGGIYNSNATATIIASTLNRNWDNQVGGGVMNYGVAGSATLTIFASTISSNSAWTGGGVCNYGGSAHAMINASTFNGNSAGYAGGSIQNSANATVEIGDTIFNAGASGGNIYRTSGTVTSHGYNLSSDNSGISFLTATGDQNNTNPMLGPLQGNGGPTWTCALLPGSPANDRGKANAVSGLGLATDQRGLPRPVDFAGLPNATGGDGSDIGAFETQITLGCGPMSLTDSTKCSDGSFLFCFTNTPCACFTVFTTTNLALPFSNWDVLGVPVEIAPGQFRFTDAQATNSPQRYYRVTSP